jgi:hypothetical protein
MKAMMRIESLAAALLAAALVPAIAQAGIFRCTQPGAAPTYQELPCPPASSGEATDIPTVYPEADRANRDRLLEREADLDRRLEARRERESRESIAATQARALEAQARAAAEPAPPAYVIGRPIRPSQRGYGAPRRPLRST